MMNALKILWWEMREEVKAFPRWSAPLVIIMFLGWISVAATLVLVVEHLLPGGSMFGDHD